MKPVHKMSPLEMAYEIDHLRRVNNQMYEALEVAPHFDKQGVGQFLNECREWYDGARKATLAAARGES